MRAVATSVGLFMGVLCLGALLPCAHARADAVFTEPCPFGAREATSHAGPRCDPWTCTSDADCEGLVCRPLRVCVQSFEIPVAGLGAFRDPPPAPSRHDLVVGSCEPGEGCTGQEEPRPPTSGRPVGEIRCAVADHCARRVLPSLPASPPPQTPTPTTPTPTPPTTAPPTTAPGTRTSAPARGNTAPAAEASGWGCAIGRTHGAPPAARLVSVLLAAMIVARTRRRARARRETARAWARRSAAIALGALLASFASLGVAHAQRVALPSPWRETRITPAPLFQSVAFACGRERAYAREREGRVAMWDGQAWRLLPPIPGERPVGSRLWVSDAGIVHADAGRELASWDGTRWSTVPIDAHFERPGFPWEMEIDVLSGLGEAPWLVGHAAIGLVVEGRVQPFDAGGAWWEIGDVLPFSRSDVLLAGRGGVTRFDGTRWARETLPAMHEYVSLHALARDDVWAAGPDSIVHWDGHAWSERSAGVTFPSAEWRRGRTWASIGGPRGAVHFATRTDVYRLGDAGWTRVLDETMRSPFEHAYGEVCATSRELFVSGASEVLVRPL